MEFESISPEIREEAIRLASELKTDVAEHLFSGRPREAEAAIRRLMQKAYPCKLFGLILAKSTDGLQLHGWNQMCRIAAVPRMTALKANFSWHCFTGMIEGGGETLHFEAGGYSDTKFDFAGTPLQEVRELGREYPQPWVSGQDMDARDLALSGMASILSVRYDYSDREEEGIEWTRAIQERAFFEKAIWDLADWWCFAAFAAKMQEAMSAQPLPRDIPLIIGNHDFALGAPQVILMGRGE